MNPVQEATGLSNLTKIKVYYREPGLSLLTRLKSSFTLPQISFFFLNHYQLELTYLLSFSYIFFFLYQSHFIEKVLLTEGNPHVLTVAGKSGKRLVFCLKWS